MPEYGFVCDSCGVGDSVIAPMSDVPQELRCKKCGAKMRRVYSFAPGGCRDYPHPIVSQSLAMNPTQIPEHRERFPDIEVTPDGCPIFTNYRQHDAYLEKTGFVKNPNRGGRCRTRFGVGRVVKRYGNLFTGRKSNE